MAHREAVRRYAATCRALQGVARPTRARVEGAPVLQRALPDQAGEEGLARGADLSRSALLGGDRGPCCAAAVRPGYTRGKRNSRSTAGCPARLVVERRIPESPTR